MGNANHKDTEEITIVDCRMLVVKATLLAALLVASAAGAVLVPEWSAPTRGTVRSTAVCPRPDGTDELWLLFDDGRLAVAGLGDTLREAGRAPAGAQAIAACRDSGFLVFPCRNELVVRRRDGTELRRVGLGEALDVDSAWCAGRVGAQSRFVFWCRDGVRSVSLDGALASVKRMGRDLVPLWARLVDVTRDGEAELVATDGSRLEVWRLDGARSLSAVWRDSAAPAGVGPAQSLLSDCDLERDGAAELVVLTDRSRPAGDSGPALYDSVRCLAGPALEQSWCVGAGSAALPGRFTAVAGSRTRVYVLGLDSSGGYIARLDEAGRCVALRRIGPVGLARPLAAFALGRWPAVVTRVGNGPEAVNVYSPSLGGSTNSAGYSGVRIKRLVALNLNRDTFPDLVVVRTSVDAGMRVDAFTNGLGGIEAELEAALEQLRAAPGQGGDINATKRTLRRVQLLSAELDPGSTQTASELEAARAVRRRQTLLFIVTLAGLLLAAGVALAVFLLLRARPRHAAAPSRQQIEHAPLVARTALAVDLVALDHNFVSKGNDVGAVERIIEVRARLGLAGDRDLGRVTDNPQPYYANAIERLITDTSTLPLVATIERAARAALRARPLEVMELSRQAHLELDRREGFRIVLIRNREYPAALRRLRLLSSPGVDGIIEHLVLDHIRYAQAHAEIVLDYTVNTQWNRKVFIQFLSDSGRKVDFTQRSGHLVSELDELASRLRGVVDTPGPDYEPAEPGEKLWLRATDLVAVLEETVARLKGTGGAE
ncbi:MAG: hypothetical protein R6X13_00565 [bacterium]